MIFNKYKVFLTWKQLFLHDKWDKGLKANDELLKIVNTIKPLFIFYYTFGCSLVS